MLRKVIKYLFIGLLVYWLIYQISFADSTISVTGSIPPKNSDFQLSISQSSTYTVNQYQTLTYTINYGSNLYYADHIKVEAQWYPGTINGQSSPSVDGMDYVLNSASRGYKSTSPTVDLVNNKLDWDIPAFPSQTTNQTLSFQLRTNNNYQGSQTVSYPVSVRIIATGFTTSNQSVTTIYQYNPLITPSPTPALTPTAAPTNTPSSKPLILTLSANTPTPTKILTNTLTPTPTLKLIPTPTFNPIQINNSFTNFSINSISSSSISLSVNTSIYSTLNLNFGKSVNNLDQNLNYSNLSASHDILVSNLNPDTTYYFQFFAKTTTGNIITSDVLNFKTAKQSLISAPVVNLNTLIFSSSGVVLSAPIVNNSTSPQSNSNTNNAPTVILPKQSVYSFNFKLTNNKKIKKFRVFIKNISVLGASNILGLEDSTNTYSIELNPNSTDFRGDLKIPNVAGVYEIYAEISDYDGNITNQKIATIIVGGPLTVFDAQNKKPLANAKVYFYFLNSKTNKYELYTKKNFPRPNPSYTNLNGIIKLILNEGEYKLIVSSSGYKTKIVYFTISPNKNSGYPQIYLKREKLNLINLLIFLKNDFSPICSNLVYYTSIPQILNLIYIINSFLIGIIFIYLFIKVFNIELSFLNIKLVDNRIVQGQILSKEDNKPLANIEVLLLKSKNMIEEVKTNKAGKFYFGQFYEKNFKIKILKQTFNLNKNGIYYVDETSKFNKLKKLIQIFLFLLLVIILIIEVFLASRLGINKTLFFIILSLINLILKIVN